ncbi:MAG: hypothetical protein RDU89_04315 [bacterium]|nr:hypothetical protein [bacterium]
MPHNAVWRAEVATVLARNNNGPVAVRWWAVTALPAGHLRTAE